MTCRCPRHPRLGSALVKTGECACRELTATARPTSPCTSLSRPTRGRARALPVEPTNGGRGEEGRGLARPTDDSGDALCRPARGLQPRRPTGARLRLELRESTQMGVGEGRRDRAPPALCSAASSAAGDCTSLSEPCWSTHANGGLMSPAPPALQLSQRCPTGAADGAAATLWGGGRGSGRGPQPRRSGRELGGRVGAEPAVGHVAPQPLRA